MGILVIPYHSPEYFEMLALRRKILREPLGLGFSEQDLQQEKDDVFIGCYENERIVGCCILTRLSSQTLKLRQMAVDRHSQEKGIGANMAAFAERYAVAHGYAGIRLHARKTAEGFYKKCGYTGFGKEFIEVGIPHILMEKLL